MRTPGALSLLFLAYLLLFMPWVAVRSARRLRQTPEGNARALPSRQVIWLSTLASQCLMLAFAWYTGSEFDYRIFAIPSFGMREILAGLAALAATIVLRMIARAVRTEEERREMMVYRIAPRNPKEWALAIVTILVTSMAEEAAYRGVGMSILWYSLDNQWIAMFICAAAFAAAHWTQGMKSMAVIFALALVLHGLVGFTDTLVIAMIVHAIYDLVAGYLISRETERYAPRDAPAVREIP